MDSARHVAAPRGSCAARRPPLEDRQGGLRTIRGTARGRRTRGRRRTPRLRRTPHPLGPSRRGAVRRSVRSGRQLRGKAGSPTTGSIGPRSATRLQAVHRSRRVSGSGLGASSRLLPALFGRLGRISEWRSHEAARSVDVGTRRLPRRSGEYPVSGVSWFEAAAYCRRCRRLLPTVFHWRNAFGSYFFSEVVTVGNFCGRGPEPRDS